MAHVAANLIDREESREFASLLAESLGETQNFEGKVRLLKVKSLALNLTLL